MFFTQEMKDELNEMWADDPMLVIMLFKAATVLGDKEVGTYILDTFRNKFTPAHLKEITLFIKDIVTARIEAMLNEAVATQEPVDNAEQQARDAISKAMAH